MKKILIVGDIQCGSGLTQFIYNVFSGLPKSDFSIYAVGYGKDRTVDLENFTRNKLKSLGWQFKRAPVAKRNPVGQWIFWYKFFKKNKFDIIYFNYSSSWNFLPILFAKWTQNAKIVCHSHNVYFSHTFSNRFLMICLTILNNFGKKIFDYYADVRIATSLKAAEWMFGKKASSKVNVINNGIDISNYYFDLDYRKQTRKKLAIDDACKLIGFVGVLDYRKNPLFAIKVFKKFNEHCPNSKFLMIGKGPIGDLVDQKIKKYHIEQSVIQIPYTASVNKLYSAMDVLLFPSLYEGFGLVPLEAQVSNLKILAANTLPKVVFVTKNITSLPINNSKTWVTALINIVNDESNRDGFDQSLSKFDSKHQFEQIEKLILS